MQSKISTAADSYHPIHPSIHPHTRPTEILQARCPLWPPHPPAAAQGPATGPAPGARGPDSGALHARGALARRAAQAPAERPEPGDASPRAPAAAGAAAAGGDAGVGAGDAGAGGDDGQGRVPGAGPRVLPRRWDGADGSCWCCCLGCLGRGVKRPRGWREGQGQGPPDESQDVICT